MLEGAWSQDEAWTGFWKKNAACPYAVLVGGNKTLILTSLESDPMIESIVNPTKTRYIRIPKERHT